MTVIARRQVRLATVAALEAAFRTEVDIQSPRAWATPPQKLPAIAVRAPRDAKTSWGRGGSPGFNTDVTIEIEGAVDGENECEAEVAIEHLQLRIEQAIFTNFGLNSIIEQFATVTTESGVTAEGERVVGWLKMSLDISLAETDWEVTYPELEGVDIHLDAIAPYDGTGTYSGTLFPASVPAAPRTSGPDGRDEGALQIDLGS